MRMSRFTRSFTLQGYLAKKNRTHLRPYSRPMPKVLGKSQGGGRFEVGEVPLYAMPAKPSGPRQTRHAMQGDASVNLGKIPGGRCNPTKKCMAWQEDRRKRLTLTVVKGVPRS